MSLDARVSVDSEPMEKPLEVVSEAGVVEAVAGEEEQIEDEMVIDEQEEIDDDEVSGIGSIKNYKNLLIIFYS